eukprot:11642310-Prorocentrum_lima.AAC.1
MDPEEVKRRVCEARAHLSFVIKLYEAQMARGAHFLHEHPASATSWDTAEMQELLGRPGVSSGIGHMCRFGMRTEPPNGGAGRLLVRKPTRWASSADE